MGSGVHYSPAMLQAIGDGDLDEMRSLVKEAEEHIRKYGNVPVVLELLKAEIAKAERGERRTST
jgi:hypothetical protein